MEGRTPPDTTLEQLRGYQYGIAGVIMPVRDGWRVHYFSVADFDAEPGTTFPDFEEAINAMAELLPVVNSPEERERATEELRERLREQPDDSS